MATQYTPILQLALPVTGEINGTWGDVVNDNITSMVEQAIAGMATISTWTANSHTLTTANGTTDEARCAMLLLQTGAGGTALTAIGEVICPARTKLYVVKNDAAYAVTVKTSAGTGISVSAGDTTFVFCDGTNVTACVTQITNGHITGNLTVDGNTTIKGNTTLGDAVGDTVTVNGTTTFVNANPTLNQGTSGRVLFVNGSKVIADAAGLTWDGTTLSATKLAGVFNGTVGATTPATGVFTQVNIAGQGDLRLEDAAGGEYVALQAPGTLAASYTLTLPVDDGTSGQVLTTDGAGVLSWTTDVGGDVDGPASATDTAVALFDGSTGKIIKNSVVTIDGSGNVSGLGTVNATTLDLTNLEVTNIKAKDCTAAITLADATGVATLSATPVLNAGTINQVQYLNGSKQLVGDADLTFDGTTLSATNITSSGAVTLSGATANGVVYANGSKVLTTGSALTFDGTTLTAPTISATSLIVSGDITWTQSTDSYSRLSGVPATTPVVTDVHRNMRRCLLRDDLTVNYYLDPTNSALKADGTASNLTGADGQVMVQIPAFYVKFTPGSNRNYAISLLPAPGFVLHPAFMKDGQFVPYRYYGSYAACVFNGSVYESGLNYDNNWTGGQNWNADGANAKLSSVSGVYPAIGATRANFRSMAANRGAGWRQVDFYLEHAVQLLFLVEYGSFNSQAKLGDGNVSVSTGYPAASGNQTDSPHSVAGKSNSLGNASTNTTSGAASGTRDVAFMSYRGIENWYGNCWEFVDGFNINSNQAYVSNVRSTFADDTATGYDSLGAPMVASNGWVTNVQQIPFGFLPSAVGGSSTTYLADYYYQNAGWRVAFFGGSAYDGASAGAFFWSLYDDSGDLIRIIGGRLAA